MAFLYNFYKEVEMETKAYSFQKSLIAFTSSSPFSIPLGEEGSGWTGTDGSSDLDAYWWGQVGANPQGITVSGTPLFDFAINETRPYNATLSPDNYWTSDTKTENGNTIYMAGFTANLGERNEQLTGMAFRFSWEDDYSGSTDRYGFKIERLYYTQSPTEGERTEWKYWAVTDGSGFAKEFLLPIYKTDASSGKGKVFLCTTTIGEKEYIVFVCGADAAGHVNENTYFYALPKSVSLPSESEPYVGPPGEDDSEEAFEPTEEKHDFIEQRELTEEQRNPFGINAGTGTGIKVVFPNLQGSGVLTRDNYLNYFLGCIYRGEAQGVFNRIEQTFSDVFNGNTNRPADQVNAMISAIICCHSIPWITNYASGTTAITSLGGYYLDLEGWGLHYYANGSAEFDAYKAKATTLVTPGQKAIFDASFTSEVIAPKLNCFLDYEPYTKMTLQIPFFKPISVSPSMVYGHTITAKYRIDILTGFLYVDIYLGNVLTTSMSTNVKTDIPIIGQGANGGGLSKIMTAISSATNSSDGAIVSNSIAAGLQIADAVSNAKAGTVVGKEGNPALSPYLSTRKAYLMTTHPKAAIPVTQNGQFTDATFLNQFGMRANLAYKLSELAGGWNKISTINLSTVNAPQHIKEDIIAKLREGVYIK